MKPVRVLVHPSDSLANIEARLREAGFKRAAVAEAGKLVRVISIDGYRPGRARGLVERDSRGCHDWGADSVAATETLDVALGHLSDRRASWLIDSVDSRRRVVGQVQT
jgi:hypothetical protein